VRPTPVLSLTIRHLGCRAGVMITASHNPPNYNGYKVYWEDGAGIVAPVDDDIINEINNIYDYANIKTMDLEDAKAQGLYNVIGEEIDDEYIKRLHELSLNPDIIKEMSDDVKIVYTPLHGTGGVLVKRSLTELGFKHVYGVLEQMEPDGNFPTTNSPNPEEKHTFELAMKLAKEVEADVVLANDPDADRVGMFVRDSKTGEYIWFNGNMLALIIVEYLISQRRERGMLPENSALIKTIVSSNMADRICEENSVELFEVLTGCKFIAALIKAFEENDNEYEVVMGFEESNGCLIGDHARDKDGVIAVQMLCEIVAFCKSKGMTLWDKMLHMYEKYGYYKEKMIAITLEGADGAKKIVDMMDGLRQNPSLKLGEFEVLTIRDYSNGKVKKLKEEREEIQDLPKSNVLYYELENDFFVVARPSGTEPKIRFYMGVRGSSLEDADEKFDMLENAVRKLM
ncbi:MAG: phospho-sugar mutase, partial [Oscillospiraceae bacterium]|nr:phospho-sugar mutase [Oscillospiraceae bacterium]